MLEERVQTLSQEIEEVTYTIEASKKENNFTLSLTKSGRKQYILSKYKPYEDAIRMLGDEWGNTSTVWVLVGLGFGYMAREIIRKVGDGARILIIEPNESLLEAQVEIARVEELQAYAEVRVISGMNQEVIKEALMEVIPYTEFKNIQVKCLEKYLEFYPKSCKVIIDLIKEVTLDMEIYFNTILRNEYFCVVNSLRNRQEIEKTCDLHEHYQKYKGVPALIVAAGPSLAKNIDLIKDFKGIIFTIGRTLGAILERGVKPDFVAAVDPFDVIYETFGNYKEHDIPLLVTADTNSKVVKGAKGPKYIMCNNTVVSGILETRINPVVSMYASVSTACLSTATYMGCSPITFIGQDLAYTEGSLHSSLALLHTEDEDANKASTSVQHPKVRGYYGGEVESDLVWISLVRWIERFIAEQHVTESEETIYINATEGGAYIEGALHLPLQEVITQYCKGEKPTLHHKPLHPDSTKDMDQQLVKALKGLRIICRGVGYGKVYYQQLTKEYEKGGEVNALRIRELFNKIQRVDQIIQQVEGVNSLMEVLMTRVKLVISTNNSSKEPIGESDKERRLRACRLNWETYEQLEIESEKLIYIIKKELEV